MDKPDSSSSDLLRLLDALAHINGSDLHLKVGSPPLVRVNGALRRLKGFAPLRPDDTRTMMEAMLPGELLERFEEEHEADFAYGVAGLGRFRVNAFRQRGSVSIAMRYVRTDIPDFEELGLPNVLRRLADEQRGMVLLTGPTGTGKTTTQAAMIDYINTTRECHIITIEDPVEYLHRDKKAAVNQREVGFDTKSFLSGLRAAMRQDPDVILVGEMRDTETVYTAINAAETGHLLLSTLHTIDAAETITRIVDFFPPYQQQQIRVALAGSLRGIVCQRLIPRADGTGRVVAVEVMINTGRIQRCILDPLQTSDIAQMVAEGEYYGMQTFDQSIANLFEQGLIDLKAARVAASNPHDLKVLLERKGLIEVSSQVG
ncbi:MAG: PilT/PilU family type 4a pilus ATPase [Actinobacteria bacterium]|jgi:twitching motility protein PilT|nr:PilT/PilU family type 4a pilus ATPase [Actinomycetota bacterium]MCL6105141.1 PilT/PilU family type 4a pilus ATPase [Actinomycetota bacterium]